jgi:UV DNA damage endonuclease
MKIGYVSTNITLGCTSARTFRLASYSPERLLETTGNNLICLLNTLHFNVAHDLRLFRISSDLVPFASHEINEVDWAAALAPRFAAVGNYARQHDLRLPMHPGQYTLLNSPDEKTYANSVRELSYHAQLLDAMGLDTTHKIQIHVGGVYGDKDASIARFIERYALLPEAITRRLAIENDDRLYSVQDCLRIHTETGIPIIFDNLHHALLNAGEPLREAFALAAATWGAADGVPLVDYSSQAEGARLGNHAETLDEADFAAYLETLSGFDFDITFEIKDKETSALKARRVLDRLERVTSNE